MPRLSVLHRSPVRRGQTHADALRDTVRFAQRIEELGYHRFWVSEHHAVPGIAGSAPTVLAAAVAAATSRIRVGTGGVMLPNHQPLVVAEQFGVLESLYPGRIDMGLGRSVGFTGAVRRALGHDREDADRYGEQLTELLGYFTGEQPVHARPAEGLRVPPFLLATGDGSAELAAEHGLPLVVAAVAGQDRMLQVVERYRGRFTRSDWAARPYVVVAATIAVAGSAQEARDLLLSEAWSTAYSRTRGEFPPLLPPAEVRALPKTERQREYLESALRGQIAGTRDEVADAVEKLVHTTAADEILVTTAGYDREALLDSYRRLVTLVGT
ncbi:MsnO8 family LLM class oxidoreductase [Amycolatopsis suaedae]|uniref:MsnO8 family LLM class oxidoreductase n=1 Tax=Amycolatopsis suaedae TaxID=2510978 RepID=A0A4V2ELZ1_9PSEU|nr:MsnO8 family LLM class oxidoreductase [Amycolatopsis suaedae]RZQ63245.1 MsnO8 family LLM class oxidoreductase [Amycolatopsis suaedae]